MLGHDRRGGTLQKGAAEGGFVPGHDVRPSGGVRDVLQDTHRAAEPDHIHTDVVLLQLAEGAADVAGVTGVVGRPHNQHLPGAHRRLGRQLRQRVLQAVLQRALPRPARVTNLFLKACQEESGAHLQSAQLVRRSFACDHAAKAPERAFVEEALREHSGVLDNVGETCREHVGPVGAVRKIHHKHHVSHHIVPLPRRATALRRRLAFVSLPFHNVCVDSGRMSRHLRCNNPVERCSACLWEEEGGGFPPLAVWDTRGVGGWEEGDLQDCYFFSLRLGWIGSLRGGVRYLLAMSKRRLRRPVFKDKRPQQRLPAIAGGEAPVFF
eukprot:Rhum_TRINITY_DN15116_c7_g4::Rhum_TRINITY_DN15116_c7_g4_i1::g.139010::m.139010